MVVCLSSFLVRADTIRKTGRFDPKLLYSQDSEFMFRLALVTDFCYVNRPLVWFDRSPAEVRHVGVSSEWNKMEFLLKDSQVRLEGLMRLGAAVPASVQRVIREQLREIHSGWTNWYLEAGQFAKARQSASKTIRTDPTFNAGVKWLLIWMSPRLALMAVERHREIRRASAGIV
jgi:hypothetical protein